MKRSDLLAVVYRFYPRGLIEGADDYWASEERYHQLEAARRGVDEYPTWQAMLGRLGARYPVMNHSVRMLAPDYLEGGACDPAYSAHLVIPGYRILFHVSVLGPYYGIHRCGVPGDEAAALESRGRSRPPIPGTSRSRRISGTRWCPT